MAKRYKTFIQCVIAFFLNLYKHFRFVSGRNVMISNSETILGEYCSQAILIIKKGETNKQTGTSHYYQHHSSSHNSPEQPASKLCYLQLSYGWNLESWCMCDEPELKATSTCTFVSISQQNTKTQP